MSLLNKIKRKNILVIGDVMLDMYYTGDVKRISPEAPVPVFRKKSERFVLGGAANVATNLVAAGQSVSMMTVIGNDGTGEILENSFKDFNIDTSLILKSERNTTIKTRFIASNNQQVMRLDVEDTEEISPNEGDKLIEMLSKKIDEFDLIVFSDYLKGLLTYNLVQGVIKLAKAHDKKVLIDVKDPKSFKYDGAFLLKPNLVELKTLTGLKVDTDEEIIKAAQALRKSCHSQYVLATCGARGMVLVGDEGSFFVNSVGKEVFDVTGAGDTTIAYLSAAVANELDIKTAVEISNYAAGLQVGKVGTSLIYLQEVYDFLANSKEGTIHKLIDINNVGSLRDGNINRKIVFTNGCFDILHVGHIRYLQEAAKLGDILVVGLNSDKSVKRLKGEDRPINGETERAELLCALEYVDYVVIFEEDTPYELIKAVQPDVLVKGGDYSPDQVVGKDIVEARGGELKLITFVEGKSTTNIIDKIKH